MSTNCNFGTIKMELYPTSKDRVSTPIPKTTVSSIVAMFHMAHELLQTVYTEFLYRNVTTYKYLAGQSKKGQSDSLTCRRITGCVQQIALANLTYHTDDFWAKMTLTSDGSTSAVGSVIPQEIDNSKAPICIFSAKLSPTQSKYITFERARTKLSCN